MPSHDRGVFGRERGISVGIPEMLQNQMMHGVTSSSTNNHQEPDIDCLMFQKLLCDMVLHNCDCDGKGDSNYRWRLQAYRCILCGTAD